MSRNVGSIDQVIRSMLGLALIAYIAKDGVVTPGWGVPVLAGGYLFVTGLFEHCPLYRVLGFTTVERIDSSS